MNMWELFMVAVGVSMDAFAIAICKGLSVEKLEKKHMAITGLWFGGAQALMPLIGYLLGSTFADAVTKAAPWLSFALLAIIGLNMIREARGDTKKLDADFSAKAIDELAQWIEQHRLPVCHWFTVDTFEHLKHGGRVSATAAAMGTILNIKPLLHVDKQGKLQAMQKPRGQRQALRKLVEYLEAGWLPDISRRIVIGHGNCPDTAASLTDMISSRFPEAQIIVGDIGPIIGAHTGPGVLALIYFGSNR